MRNEFVGKWKDASHQRGREREMNDLGLILSDTSSDNEERTRLVFVRVRGVKDEKNSPSMK